MKTKPDLGFWKLWNLSFGFFGVQIAYALQSAQVSRIFSTIGADPHDLSYFWILPPLMGLIVQPIIGSASDRTWNRFGRRLPYLIFGALIAVIVMCFLPNAGSLGLSLSAAIMFGLVMLMFLDTSLNMAMQPFKMLVGDMVNEKQKGLAYSIQSFLCNAGSVVGYVAPFALGTFLATTAPQGEVPPTVTYSFYIGAAAIVLCVIYTLIKVKEMPPHVYAEYNGDPKPAADSGKKENMLRLLVKAPKVFWTVGLVQFFCWAAFLYMWTYSTDGIAGHAFHCPATQKVTGIVIDGQHYDDNYILHDGKMVISKGRLMIAGIDIDGQFVEPRTVIAGNDTIIKNGQIHYINGLSRTLPGETFANAGETIIVDDMPVTINGRAVSVSAKETITANGTLSMAHIAKYNAETNLYELEEVTEIPGADAADIELSYTTVLNTESVEYQKAGDWNGNLLAVQGIAALLWALLLPKFRNRRTAYTVSLLVGAAGFISIWFLNTPGLLFISYAMIGAAWAAMLALPFTILTNALSGNHIGTYLGLFNCTICIPQIVAAIVGGSILSLFPVAANGVTQTVFMLMVSGLLLVIGAIAVWGIKEKQQ